MNTYTPRPPDNCELKDIERHFKEDGQTILTFKINGEDVDYVYDKSYYGKCECGESTFQFGYISGNNSLNAYCDHCWKKYPKSLSKHRKAPRRNSKHLYFRQDQRDKDRHFCEICFHDKDLEVHHIVEVKEGGDDEPDNLQLLCKSCHTIVHRIRDIIRRTYK